jgi:hypothetical protein
MQTILERRRKLLSMPAVFADAGSGRESLRVQLWITALLGVLLTGVACLVSN